VALTQKYGRSAGIYSLAAIKAAKRKRAKKDKKLEKKLRKKTNNWKYPLYYVGMGDDFYLTREWKNVRWGVLIASHGKCAMCGSGKENGVILHVDHIQPRSKFPTLELSPSNLQVLCEPCNIGKGSSTWKPE